MKLAALQDELRQGRLRGAYLVAGEEPLLRGDALTALRGAVLGDGPADFNLDRLDGARTRGAALSDALRVLPVMSSRRLVILEDPDARAAAARGLTDVLAEEVPGLGAEAACVLVVLASKPDRRSRWVKAFGDAVVDCDPPRGLREIAAFVRAEAKRQEVALERGVAELLAERTGPQLLMLRQEIAKVSLLAGPGRPVARSHVAAGTLDVAEEPIWDLTDAIGEGRADESLRLLNRLLAHGAAPPLVLGTLVSHFRKLLRVGHGGAVAAPPFVRKKLDAQARRYGPRRLRACLGAIHETDLALKGAGALRPERALERLVIALSG